MSNDEHFGKTATLHRMVTPEHVCPYGLKAKELLEKSGFAVDDRQLTSRQATDEFKHEHNVATTPLIFIDGERIGGYDALEEKLGTGENA
jgi:glutaredoxin